MKRLLVTGASGFLGRRIAEFYGRNYEVVTPGHQEMDITDKEKVSAVFHDFKPHFVIHSAAVSDVGMCEKEPERSWKMNVEGSRNIALASAELHAKCLMCSSDQIYFGSRIPGPHREDESVNPLNVYGRQKKQAEEECLAENPKCVMLRLSWMYDTVTKSRYEHGDFFRTLALGLKKKEILRYPVHDVRGITDVNEVVRNLENGWELEGGIYNFGSPNDRNTYETVTAMFTELGWDAGQVRRNEEAFAPSPRDISMNTDKINKNGIVFSSTLDGLIRNGRLLKPTKESK